MALGLYSSPSSFTPARYDAAISRLKKRLVQERPLAGSITPLSKRTA